MAYCLISLQFALTMETAHYRMFVNVTLDTLDSNVSIHPVMAFCQIFPMCVQEMAIAHRRIHVSASQDMEGINASSLFVMECCRIPLQFAQEMELAPNRTIVFVSWGLLVPIANTLLSFGLVRITDCGAMDLIGLRSSM